MKIIQCFLKNNNFDSKNLKIFTVSLQFLRKQIISLLVSLEEEAKKLKNSKILLLQIKALTIGSFCLYIHANFKILI